MAGSTAGSDVKGLEEAHAAELIALKAAVKDVLPTEPDAGASRRAGGAGRETAYGTRAIAHRTLLRQGTCPVHQ
jgi:hypothetical protein